MKTGKRYSKMLFEEYLEILNHYKEYPDFNTLGFYRSLTENNNLTVEQKICLREIGNRKFAKTFEFLQVKDPETYVKIVTLGQKMTDGDKIQLWREVVKSQERILKQKRLGHRNFGIYSKHTCPYEDCPYNGLMVKQGSPLAYGAIHFSSDKRTWNALLKSERQKKDSRQWKEKRNDLL